MSPQDRALALDQLRSGWRRLEESVAGLTEAQWNFRPSEGVWSVKDCVEHVAAVEDAVGKALRSAKDGAAAHAASNTDEVVMSASPDRRRKIKASADFEPTGRGAFEETWKDCQASRHRTIAFAETTSRNLREIVFPHPFLSRLDGVQWLLALAGHGERHRQQIDELKQLPEFPAPDGRHST